MEDQFTDRINVRDGEIVAPEQARPYGSASEILADFGMVGEPEEAQIKWLRELWILSAQLQVPVSDLLVMDFYDRGAISDEEYADYMSGAS